MLWRQKNCSRADPMPLIFDLPFEEVEDLYRLQPSPPDFNAFWEHGLEELQAVEPSVRTHPG